VLTFCLDDNYGWDDGLICGGRMSMLVDPLVRGPDSRAAEQVRDYFQRFRELAERGGGCTEAVILGNSTSAAGFTARTGTRYLFDADGQLTAQLGDDPVPDEVHHHLTPLQKRPAPSAHRGIAYLPILPRATLLIVGGGHVGQAVARLAAEVDFDIWVLDDRQRYASRERFPQAQRLLVGDIGASLKDLVPGAVNESVYALIVTRGHAHDEEALYHLAPSAAGYVGMIGSKRKIRLIFEDLLARGISEEVLAKVHAPLGFNIGSQTVPEIAVSIVAELIARRNLGATIAEAREWVKVGHA
jgi:xanthine dehydrogenase accessory factor